MSGNEVRRFFAPFSLIHNARVCFHFPEHTSGNALCSKSSDYPLVIESLIH